MPYEFYQEEERGSHAMWQMATYVTNVTWKSQETILEASINTKIRTHSFFYRETFIFPLPFHKNQIWVEEREERNSGKNLVVHARVLEREGKNVSLHSHFSLAFSIFLDVINIFSHSSSFSLNLRTIWRDSDLFWPWFFFVHEPKCLITSFKVKPRLFFKFPLEIREYLVFKY